jgi:CheY-like chemotaxis protein
MRLLIVEDEVDFIDQVRAAVRQSGQRIDLVTSRDIGLEDPIQPGSPFEEQLLSRVREAQQRKPMDLVLLDSDLSRSENGLAQSMCRQAFQDVGLPVCRYKKRHSTTKLRELQDLRRTAREGASAIWVPSEMVQTQNLADRLLPWLVSIGDGFRGLRDALRADQSLLKKNQGPAGILALVLGRPSAKADFLGYTAQNFFFFGAPAGEDDDSTDGALSPDILATQLGYWLFNYILRFPGPILSLGAAAAYLNVQPEAMDDDRLRSVIASARYVGPFSGVEPFYWRDDLASVLDELGGEIGTAPALRGVEIQRVDGDSPSGSALFCVLTQQPIAEAEAAPAPDWIPPGAHLARIQRALYDQLGPMLSI